MPTTYICESCNCEPLYLKNGRCPKCGGTEAVKITKKDNKNKTFDNINLEVPNEKAS